MGELQRLGQVLVGKAEYLEDAGLVESFSFVEDTVRARSRIAAAGLGGMGRTLQGVLWELDN